MKTNQKLSAPNFRLLATFLFVGVFFLSVGPVHASTTVTTSCQVVISNPDISCSFSSNPSTLIGGQTATFTWSSGGADTCTGSGFQTSGAPSGTSPQITVIGGNVYQVQCTSSTGVNPCTKQITAASPAPFITASPSRVKSGTDADVAWSALNVSVCSLMKNGSAFNPVSLGGSITPDSVTKVLATSSIVQNIIGQTIYKLTCDGVTSTAVVNVHGGLNEF